MAEQRATARLSGERIVGVDASGAIAIVLGIMNVPTPLWADMLVGLDTRPVTITHLSLTRNSGAPAQPPMQIDLRVSDPTDIGEALDWLVASIDEVNGTHDAHERRLAAVYEQALGTVNRWFDTTARPFTSHRDPTLN